jgi:hypothetical protein
MSHYSLVKIKIKNVNENVLRQAIQELCKHFQFQVVNQIVDFYGHPRTDFLIGIKNRDYPRGVGIKLAFNGQITLVGDFYNTYGPQYISQLISQYYTVQALKIGLKKIGYNTHVVKEGEKVLIHAFAV